MEKKIDLNFFASTNIFNSTSVWKRLSYGCSIFFVQVNHRVVAGVCKSVSLQLFSQKIEKIRKKEQSTFDHIFFLIKPSFFCLCQIKRDKYRAVFHKALHFLGSNHLSELQPTSHWIVHIELCDNFFLVNIPSVKQ